MESMSERALREREQYNQGLKRQTYNSVLNHTSYFYDERRDSIIREQLQYANERRVLEIGSQSWIKWIERNQIRPKALHCINISEKELQKGSDVALETRVKPNFSLMNANDLEFPDESFDMVFGGSILHHLDFTRALDEIRRVLKPQGRILFTEPLDNNPIGKIVRAFTPQARTEDEQPLRTKEFAELQDRFDTSYYYQQLLSVPLGLVSKSLFRRPDNALMKWAYRADRFLDSKFPPLRKHYRRVIIAGVKR